MEPTRVEVDLPQMVIDSMGSLRLDNMRSLSDIVTPSFHKGEVVSIHIILESTRLTRGFCEFVDTTSSYKSKCNHVLSAEGTCWLEEQHERARQKAAVQAKQLELESEESDD